MKLGYFDTSKYGTPSKIDLGTIFGGNTVGHIDLIFYVHILRAYYAKYEVSVIKPLARRTVHRRRQYKQRHMTDNS